MSIDRYFDLIGTSAHSMGLRGGFSASWPRRTHEKAIGSINGTVDFGIDRFGGIFGG